MFTCPNIRNLTPRFARLRIVVQAAPPFLVVQSNAAYWRLTGISSHHVVGKPVSGLLSIHKGGVVNQPDDVQPAELASADDGPADHPPNDLGVEASARPRAVASERDRQEMTLERLIAASGFGRIHMVHVNTRPHRIGGLDVPGVNGVVSGSSGPVVCSRGEACHSNSVTSSCNGDGLHQPPIACRISIAPIVSSNATIGNGALSNKEAEYRNHRGHKHHESRRKPPPKTEVGTYYRKHQPLQLVTHFVVQFQPQCVAVGETGSLESLSSDSACFEAQLLGLTKLELQRGAVASGAPQQAEQEDEDAGGSISVTAERDAVAAIG
jgi:hypothetical protein